MCSPGTDALESFSAVLGRRPRATRYIGGSVSGWGAPWDFCGFLSARGERLKSRDRPFLGRLGTSRICVPCPRSVLFPAGRAARDWRQHQGSLGAVWPRRFRNPRCVSPADPRTAPRSRNGSIRSA